MKKIFLVLFSALQLVGANIDWGFPPDVISSAGQNVDQASITIDPNGNAVAVWTVGGIIKAKSKLANMSWSSEVNLSVSGASLPCVVSDANGNATALWLENGVVKVSSKTLVGNWTSATSLSGTGASSPSLAIDSSGNLVVAWARSGDIQSRTKLFGGSWETTVTINGSVASRPHVSIGGSGANTTAVVVFEDVAASVNVVYGASKLISTSAWGTKQIISNSSQAAGFPRVSVDISGNATAVWYGYSVIGSNYYGVAVNSSYRPAAGKWEAATRISEEGLANPANLFLRVGCDNLGNALAIWSNSFDGEHMTVQSATKFAYTKWSTPINLVAKNLYSFFSSSAVTSFGDAIAVGMFYDGSDLLIQSAELDITNFSKNSWTLPANLSTSARNAKPVVCARVGNEDAIHTAAIWIGENGLVDSAYASVGKKNLVSAPSNLSVTQSANDFSVFTEYYNTLVWDPSEDPNTVGYLVFRNGVFVQQVEGIVTEFIDNNKVQNGAVVYGVAAVDAQQSHSKIITVSFP